VHVAAVGIDEIRSVDVEDYRSAHTLHETRNRK